MPRRLGTEHIGVRTACSFGTGLFPALLTDADAEVNTKSSTPEEGAPCHPKQAKREQRTNGDLCRATHLPWNYGRRQHRCSGSKPNPGPTTDSRERVEHLATEGSLYTGVYASPRPSKTHRCSQNRLTPGCMAVKILWPLYAPWAVLHIQLLGSILGCSSL